MEIIKSKNTVSGSGGVEQQRTLSYDFYLYVKRNTIISRERTIQYNISSDNLCCVLEQAVQSSSIEMIHHKCTLMLLEQYQKEFYIIVLYINIVL
jgi:hypothetical protein